MKCAKCQKVDLAPAANDPKLLWCAVCAVYHDLEGKLLPEAKPKIQTPERVVIDKGAEPAPVNPLAAAGNPGPQQPPPVYEHNDEFTVTIGAVSMKARRPFSLTVGGQEVKIQ